MKLEICIYGFEMIELRKEKFNFEFSVNVIENLFLAARMIHLFLNSSFTEWSLLFIPVLVILAHWWKIINLICK